MIEQKEAEKLKNFEKADEGRGEKGRVLTPRPGRVNAGHIERRERGSSVKYYMIGEVETKDESWGPDYVKNVTGMVGGGVAGTWRVLLKLRRSRVSARLRELGDCRMPSKEVALAFYDSEEYRPYRQTALLAAKNEFCL